MINSSPAFGRQYQDLLVTHIIRCPRHHSLIVLDRISDADFDFPVLQGLIRALKNVFDLYRDNKCGIPVDTRDLIPAIGHQLGQMMKVQTLDPLEFGMAIQFLQWAFSQQLTLDYC